MAFNINCSFNYGTHLPALLKVMSLTDGDVLELGTGVFSTPLLHYLCMLNGRNLVSYDNDAKWDKWVGYYRAPFHKILYVDNWDDADIERPWDVALVDHSPSIRRKEDIRRLANHAKYIVVHDTTKTYYHTYKYHEIWDLFQYRKVWDGDQRRADVFSNFVDLKDLW